MSRGSLSESPDDQETRDGVWHLKIKAGERPSRLPPQPLQFPTETTETPKKEVKNKEIKYFCIFLFPFFSFFIYFLLGGTPKKTRQSGGKRVPCSEADDPSINVSGSTNRTGPPKKKEYKKIRTKSQRAGIYLTAALRKSEGVRCIGFNLLLRGVRGGEDRIGFKCPR
jgi:hypothetical protein